VRERGPASAVAAVAPGGPQAGSWAAVAEYPTCLVVDHLRQVAGHPRISYRGCERPRALSRRQMAALARLGSSELDGQSEVFGAASQCRRLQPADRSDLCCAAALAMRHDVAAAAAYDSANPSAPLPHNAAHLLAVMFPSGDVCQRSQEAIAAEGFSRDRLPSMLRRLVAAGFLSRHRVAQVPDTYRLHLPATADAA
jgi:hypothetical protein